MRHRLARLALLAIIAMGFALGSAVSFGAGPASASTTTVTGSSVVDVAAGGDHTCVVNSGPSLACWGRNASGVQVPSTTHYAKIAAGTGFTCGIRYTGETNAGSIDCWGLTASTPITSHIAGDFDQIAAGDYHVCARATSDWTVTCWGDNYANRATPPAGTQAYLLSAGYDSTCAIIGGGALSCWGNDGSGQTDAPSGNYSDVTTGYAFSCALHNDGNANDGTVACWGFNPDGRATPPAGVVFTDIESAWAASCGILKSDHTLQCWGSDGNITSAPSGAFRSLSGGDTHMCGLTYTTGSLVCWGDPFNSHFDPSMSLSGASATAGQALNATIGGTSIWPVSWSESGSLPAGLTFSSSTASITGTATAANYYPVTLSTSVLPFTVSFDSSVSISAGATAEVDLTPSSSTVEQGGHVDIDVNWYDAYGNLVGGGWSPGTLSSDDPADTWSGETVTFPFDLSSAITTSVVHTISTTVDGVDGSVGVTVTPKVAQLFLTSAPSTATAGDTITVGAQAQDSGGTDLGDVSSYLTVTSDVPEDVVSGNQVTFTHASPHTITVTYGTLSTSFLVEVSPAKTGGGSGVSGLALTGSNVLPWVIAAAALEIAGSALVMGAAFVAGRRRMQGRRPARG